MTKPRWLPVAERHDCSRTTDLQECPLCGKGFCVVHRVPHEWHCWEPERPARAES